MTSPTTYATFFRDWWTTRLVDECLVKRPASTMFVESTGTYQVVYSTCYSGPCLVRPSAMTDAQSGEQQAEIRFYNVILPHTATDIDPDDLVDITTSADSYLQGLQMVVRNVGGDTYNHVRRVRCEEVVGG